MLVWRPIGAVHEDAHGSSTKLAWCKGEPVSMAQEIAKTDGILAEAKRQVKKEMLGKLVEYRRRLEQAGTYDDGCRALLFDVGQALGFDGAGTAYVEGDIDSLWVYYLDAKAAAK